MRSTSCLQVASKPLPVRLSQAVDEKLISLTSLPGREMFKKDEMTMFLCFRSTRLVPTDPLCVSVRAGAVSSRCRSVCPEKLVDSVATD